MAELTLKPIGIFNGCHQHKSAVPRQGSLSLQHGFIEFNKNFDAGQALKGLSSMSHVWIIFSFHKAQAKAKPLVRPPRKPEIQVGVWATRSPYRPNSLGLTLACVDKVEGKILFLSEIDLLDQTPIVDIKPYVTESDRPKKPKLGWIDDIQVWKYTLSPLAKKQVHWLSKNGLNEIFDVLESQFGTPPLQPKRKRVKLFKKYYVLSYRTWRFCFKISQEKYSSQIFEIRSGYSSEELNSFEDLYQDKDLHRRFINFT